jgi:hypothetical protein
MRKLLLLLIPLLFVSCNLDYEKCRFNIFNETDIDMLVIVDCKKAPSVSEVKIYSRSYCEYIDYPKDCDYTVKVRAKNCYDYTTFIIHPKGTYQQYYIRGNADYIRMSSSVSNGKSEDIKRIPPD